MQNPVQQATGDLCPRYLDEESGKTASRIDLLYPERSARFDPDGVRDFFSSSVAAHSTCFAGTRRMFSVFKKLRPTAGKVSLKKALLRQLEGVLEAAENPVMALSGGIDSVILALLAKEINGEALPSATIVTDMPGYCERERTVRIAEELGLADNLSLIESSREDFVSAFPAAVRGAELPFYNLHPVSKWIFAKEIKKRGFQECISGDGADELFKGGGGIDYLPVVGSVFSFAGVKLVCPFLSDNLAGWLGADEEKVPLRDLAESCLPEWFTSLPKRRGFAPLMDLSEYQVDGAIEELSGNLGFSSPKMHDPFYATLWVSMLLLEKSHINSCAESEE